MRVSPCGLAEKWPFWPKIHISRVAHAQCLSWVDPSMVRYVYFLRFHRYPRYCISPIFPVQNPLNALAALVTATCQNFIVLTSIFF